MLNTKLQRAYCLNKKQLLLIEKYINGRTKTPEKNLENKEKKTESDFAKFTK